MGWNYNTLAGSEFGQWLFEVHRGAESSADFLCFCWFSFENSTSNMGQMKKTTTHPGVLHIK